MFPIRSISVAAVSDEGQSVVVWGWTDDAPDDREPVGYVVWAEGDGHTVVSAEGASRLVSGTEAAVEYTAVIC